MILTSKFVFKRTPFDIPIGLFLLSQIISTIVSIDPYVSFWGYYTRFNGGLLSLLTYAFFYYAFTSNFLGHENENDQKTMKHENKKAVENENGGYTQTVSYKVLFVSALSGFAVALWGFPSHFGHDLTCLVFRGTFDVSCWTDAFQPNIRLFSTLGQPNWLAAYFSILIPICLAIGIFKIASYVQNTQDFQLKNLSTYLKDKLFLLPIFFLFLSFLFFAELLWSQSQSGYLGLLSGLFIFFAGILFVYWRKSKTKKLIEKICIPVLVLFVLISFMIGNPLDKRFAFLSSRGLSTASSPSKTPPAAQTAPAIPALEGGGSDSGKIRLVVWGGALELFKRNPLFGTGAETFAYAYYSVKPIEHNLLSEWDYLYNKAHNEYLNYLATTGIVGLGTYLLMIGWVFYYSARWLFKNRKSHLDDPRALLVLSLLGAYMSILVSNFFGFSVVVINLYMFFIPGLIIAFTQKQKNTTAEQDVIAAVPPKKTVLILVAAVICIYFELFLLNLWFADQEYSLGYNLDRAQEYVLANTHLENAVKLAPNEDLFKNELALNLATLGLLLTQQNQATQGAEFINKAVTLSNDVVNKHPHNVVFYKTRIQTFFVLSQVNNKYFQEALDSIKKARKLAPSDAKVAYNEGLLLGQNGNVEDAIAVLKEAIQLKPNYRDPRYAIAVYYVQKAKDTADTTLKTQYQDVAKEMLMFNLEHIDPSDKQSKELLDSIK